MPVRVFIAAAIAMALGLSAGAAQACACHRVVHPVVRHHADCHCRLYHRASLRHARHVRVRVIERTVRVEHSESWGEGDAYRYAEADRLRWEASRNQYALRPSPPHPWATDRSGYLTWSGKEQTYYSQGYDQMGDRYSGADRDPWSDEAAGCPNRCAPLPPGPPPR